jgi:hypothetical protein
MTAASLSPGIAETVVRIIWLSIASPRQAVRELLSAADVRTVSFFLVSLGIAFSTTSAGISEWFNLRNQTNPDQFVFFGPGEAVAEAGTWALVQTVIGVVGYPLTALIWMYVFGFRDKAWLVWGAVATTYGLLVITDPILNIVGHFSGTLGEIDSAGLIVLAIYSAVVITLSSYYFVEALSIGLLRAVLINSTVFAMLMVCIVVVPFVVFWFFGFMIYDGTENSP